MDHFCHAYLKTLSSSWRSYYTYTKQTTVHRADRQELKKLLAVYYGQSISVDPYPDYDGQQWE